MCVLFIRNWWQISCWFKNWSSAHLLMYFFQRPILQLLTLSIYVLCVLFIRHLWHSTWILRSFTYLFKAFWHVFYVEHKWWWSKNWSLAHSWSNFLPLGGSKWLLFELRNEWPSYESTNRYKINLTICDFRLLHLLPMLLFICTTRSNFTALHTKPPM